jgi:hypothetical protein
MPDATPRPTREYGLDWLRVLAFLILIFYHTGMFFVPWEFHLKNPEQSTALTYVMLFFNRWRLPLLFFISGAGVAFSLRRRSLTQFAGERVRRLFIPLVFGMFVIVPPQIYFERLWRGQFSGSYLEFWPSVLHFVPYPKGSFSWHHLWFVVYILVYSLICLPVFAGLKSAATRRFFDRAAGWLGRPGVIYLLNLPSIAVALTLGPHWPTTHNLVADWANFCGSLVTFLWGFILCGNARLLEVVTRKRREFLVLALILTVVFFGLHPSRVPRTIIEAYYGMAWIFAAVGYSRVYLNRPGARLSYATEAVYPFYIAHQTVLIALAYPMIGWSAPISVKLPLLAAGTFLGSWAIFELTRRWSVTRVLMGMKPRPAAA